MKKLLALILIIALLLPAAALAFFPYGSFPDISRNKEGGKLTAPRL